MNIPAAALNQHIAVRPCERCGAEFQVTKKHRKKRFCSISCSRKTLPSPSPKLCVRCGAEFQPTAKYPQQRFCGHKCQWADRGGASYNSRVAKSSAKKRGDAQRGRGSGKSYPKLNGRHAHRVVAEQKIGRPLKPGEIVHHKDEVKTNYAAENLEVLPSQSEHAKRHANHLAAARLARKQRKAGCQ